MRNRTFIFSASFLIILCVPIWIAAGKNSTILYEEAVKIALSGDIDKAITAFKKVIEVNPYYSLGHYGLGKVYLYKEGKQRDALKHLRLSVKYDKRLVRGHFYLGIAFMHLKRYNDAIRAFKEAYRLDRKYIEALYNIGVVYEMLENNQKAEEYYSEYHYQKAREEDDILF